MENVILRGVVGSTAYGLATPESDIDRLGIFVTPTRDILGIFPQRETYVQNDPDMTLHELGKFISLSIANNPTIMELLWLENYELIDWAGSSLIDNRQLFLSQRIRNTYGGYAKQQSQRLLKRGGNFDPDLKKRTAKHGRHCFRLLIQGRHALQHGEIKIRLTPDEVYKCREMGELAESNPERFSEYVENEFAIFDSTATDLPYEPDLKRINEILLDIRMDY